MTSSSSAASLMDPEVVEIPPRIFRTSKLLKQKEVVFHDVIDIDKDEDSADVMFIDEKIDISNKGKAIKDVSDGYGDLLAKEGLVNYLFGPSDAEILGSVNGVESSQSFDAVSHNLINIDCHSPDLSYDDNNEYIDLFSDDFMDVDEYAILQAHFDSMDIPPGIEAPIPWLPDFGQCQTTTVTGSSSHHTGSQMHSDAVCPHGIDSSLPSSSSKTAPLNVNPTSVYCSSLQAQIDAVQAQIDAVIYPSEVDLSSPWPFSQAAQSKKKPAASQHRGSFPNLPLGTESSKSRRFWEPFKNKKKPVASSSSTNFSPVNQLEGTKLPPGVQPSFWGQYTSDSVKKQGGINSTNYPSFPVHMDSLHYSPGVEPSKPWWQESLKSKVKPSFINHTTNSSFFVPYDNLHIPPEDSEDIAWVLDSAQHQRNVATDGSSTFPVEPITSRDKDEIMKKFQLFKQFDTVEDCSDHYYTRHGSSMKQPSKNWAKRIQEEWKILEKDLPDKIFVRVYETRMDLLRAVIIGAEGTPYHDGLFFFDVFFPSGYPNVPPNVHYHSGGLRLNPNLYNCGKVCLSLLNTWSGNKNEKWIPGVSTMLQVLVSIQGLILNTKPYFNEPGYARMSGSVNGEMKSQQYNEDIFILSLKTMMYTMKRPPKHFEDFVAGHFCNHAHDVLVACKAYMDGAQVGCLVKGGVQDVDEGDKSCSKQFKESLVWYVDTLVKVFTRIGVKDCEKYQSPAINGNKRFCGMPKAAT